MKANEVLEQELFYSKKNTLHVSKDTTSCADPQRVLQGKLSRRPCTSTRNRVVGKLLHEGVLSH